MMNPREIYSKAQPKENEEDLQLNNYKPGITIPLKQALARGKQNSRESPLYYDSLPFQELPRTVHLQSRITMAPGVISERQTRDVQYNLGQPRHLPPSFQKSSLHNQRIERIFKICEVLFLNNSELELLWFREPHNSSQIEGASEKPCSEYNFPNGNKEYGRIYHKALTFP